jgi:hypothetical protein
MSADIANIVRTGTPDGKSFGIIVFLDLNFIKGVITIIPHSEVYGMHQLVMVNQFHKSLRIYFLAPADHFVSSRIIYVFNKIG